jgi:hypothetical protein
MFEHYSGLNKVPLLNDACPVGALVPQFYGYCVPQLKEDEEEGDISLFSPRVMTQVDGVPVEEESKKVKQGFKLSPILLLEDCGTCITRSDLSDDEGYVNLVPSTSSPDFTYPIPGSKWLPSSTVSTKQGGHTSPSRNATSSSNLDL